MRIKLLAAMTLFAALAGAGCGNAYSANPAESGSRIAWYGTLDSGLAEAQRSGRPILLVSGAPQCLGVPGIW